MNGGTRALTTRFIDFWLPWRFGDPPVRAYLLD
jgi:hypothetical protein